MVNPRAWAAALAAGAVVGPVAAGVVFFVSDNWRARNPPPLPAQFAALADGLLVAQLVVSALLLVASFGWSRHIAGDQRGLRIVVPGAALLKLLATVAALAVARDASLQTWQAALALALPDVVFWFMVLTGVAHLFETERGRADLARSTLQLRWVFVVYRCAVLLVWVVPPDVQVTLTLCHRALAPFMGFVFAVLLLKSMWRPAAARAALDRPA